ncbi:MAG: asparagine synthase-related protein [Verrucomicrobiae bacterium]|nr:asparagine synthase-related protein [Verrucomicrobiae bacterium]
MNFNLIQHPPSPFSFFWNPASSRERYEELLMADTPFDATPYHGQHVLTWRKGTDFWAARDPFGVAKLFYTLPDKKGTFHLGHSLCELMAQSGAGFEKIFSIPAGHAARFDLAQGRVFLKPYYTLPQSPDSSTAFDMEGFGRKIRSRLDDCLGRLLPRLGASEIHVTLSGGLDSTMIAALLKHHADKAGLSVTAFTFSVQGHDGENEVSEDMIFARKAARDLKIPLREVAITRQNLIEGVDDALRHGMDWRDFNHHCALANLYLARAIREYRDSKKLPGPGFVFTGELMNELTADYTTVEFDGADYYVVPKLGKGRLRRLYLQGMDSASRETGVFRASNLEAMEPYFAVAEDYLQVPEDILIESNAKQQISAMVGGDLVPGYIFDRKKVREQVGSEKSGGVLKTLIRAGITQDFLKRRFSGIFRIPPSLAVESVFQLGRFRRQP